MIFRNFISNRMWFLDPEKIIYGLGFFQKTKELAYLGCAVSICILIVGWFLSKYLLKKMIDIFKWKVKWDRNRKIKCLRLCQKDVILMIKNSNCNPIMLRLAWSDAGTYDKNISSWPQCGGCNGSIRLDNENQQTVNKGLEKALSLLFPIKIKYPTVSWADLIQMAGANAVTLCGGPHIALKYGRIDIPKNFFPNEKLNLAFCLSQSKKLPCNYFPYPDGSHTPEFHIRNVFFRLGFSSREIVALCGAHTIGRGFRDRTGVCPFSSGDRGATQYTRLTSLAKGTDEAGIGMAGGMSWTTNWLQFDNSYYRRPYAHLRQIRNETKSKSKHSNVTNSRNGSFTSTSTVHGSGNENNNEGRKGSHPDKDRRSSLSSVGSAGSLSANQSHSAILSSLDNFHSGQNGILKTDEGDLKDAEKNNWKLENGKKHLVPGSLPIPVNISMVDMNSSRASTPVVSPREMLEDQCSVDSALNSMYSGPDRNIGTEKDREKEKERNRRRDNLKSTNSVSSSSPSLCPLNSDLLWLPTDDALYKSPEFKFYFEQYATDQKLFFSDYSLVHRKMSELGSKFDPPSGIELQEGN